MKSSALLLTVLLGVVGACSSNSDPHHPPLSTTGPTNPPTGGGGSTTPGGPDGGTEADSAAPAPVGDGGQLCSAGGCNGCCNALGFCDPGTTNTACGVSAVACSACTLGQNCTNGFCQ
ncbi:MAG TPA: hypothetical protein VIF09_07330 [Polyangiaceae bacterium]|jgi:hypothetical protein